MLVWQKWSVTDKIKDRILDCMQPPSLQHLPELVEYMNARRHVSHF